MWSSHPIGGKEISADLQRCRSQAVNVMRLDSGKKKVRSVLLM